MEERKLSLGMRFAILHRAFRRQLDECLREKGLTGVQFGVLKLLTRLEAEGAQEVRQCDLESGAHVTHPTMTEIIKRLEREGFVVCAQSVRDRRSKSIRSTEKTQALLSEFSALDGNIARELLEGVTQEEYDALIAATDKMLEKIFSGCEKGSDCRD